MRTTTRGLALIAVAVLGCSAIRPVVVAAPDEPFPVSFVDASPWLPLSIGPMPGSPVQSGSFDVLVKQLDGYLQAGIRATRARSGVRITVPDGASQAQQIRLFVTIIGGATDVSSGQQMRLLIRRDANGWWLDPKAEFRVYCDRALSGVSGDACL